MDMDLDDLLLILIYDEGKRDYDELSLLSRQWLCAEFDNTKTHEQMRDWFNDQIPRILEWADLMEQERQADTIRLLRES